MRSVEARLVKARDDEVALVVVLFNAVKFCKVDDPVTKRLASVPRPLMNVVPSVAKVEKRLVDDAVVANLLVEVPFVVVELSAVKFWRVEEPAERRLARELVPR